MALRWKFDLVEGSYVRNTIHGREICRRCRVFDLPVQALGTAYAALLNIIKDPQCPILNTLHPDPTTQAFLEEQKIVSVEKPKRYVDIDLIYRAAPITPGGQDVIAWTVTDSSISDHAITNQVSDLKAPLKVWYKKGTAPNIKVQPDLSSIFGPEVHKIIVHRVIRVTGRATRQQWASVKQAIRGARGKIHSDNWGGYPRGTWMFFGPNTHTIDRGNTYDISLEFAEAENGWFPVGFYRDENGKIPADIASEFDARSSGAPLEGRMELRNGIMVASIYRETPFTPLFKFTPDDEPQPS